MLSRVADSIFWMSRYMERSNSMLRLVRTHYIASQDDLKEFNWNALMDAYHIARESSDNQFSSLSEMLHFLIIDKRNIDSVFNNVTLARENARAVQDHITKEVWQALNDYYHLMRDPSIHQQILSGDPVTAMDAFLKQSMLFYGMVDNTMGRGEGFNFLNIGKYLERSVQTIQMLHFKVNSGYDPLAVTDSAEWRYFLFSVSAYELYLKTYRGSVQPNLAVQLTVHNDHFPHSIIYCLQQIHRYFDRLQPDSLEEHHQQLNFLIGKATTMVRYDSFSGKTKEQLTQSLRLLFAELVGIAQAFNKFYFGFNS